MVLSYISRPLDGPKYIYSYVDKAHYRKLVKLLWKFILYLWLRIAFS